MRVAFVAALLFLAACGAGDGVGLNEDGQPLGQASVGAACGTGVTPSVTALPGSPVQPTLASIQAYRFSVTCAVSGCHGGAGAQQGLRLDAGFSAGNLICVKSPQDPTLTRVIPGDPDNSLIIQKLEGRRFDNAPILGARMPDGGPLYLQQSEIDVIRLWIANGAPTQ